MAQCIQAIEVLFAHVTFETFYLVMTHTLSSICVTSSTDCTIFMTPATSTPDTWNKENRDFQKHLIRSTFQRVVSTGGPN